MTATSTAQTCYGVNDGIISFFAFGGNNDLYYGVLFSFNNNSQLLIVKKRWVESGQMRQRRQD